MNNWEPKAGDIVEVSMGLTDWYCKELFAMLPNSTMPYVVFQNENKTILEQYTYARPIKRDPDKLKLWDVVETRDGDFGIVTGFRNEDFVVLYIPSLLLVNMFSLRGIKLRKDKVAMAPATITRVYIERADGAWTPIKLERESFGLFSSIENARSVIKQFFSYNREDVAKTSSYVSDESICWPHSIASMTIEDK